MKSPGIGTFPRRDFGDHHDYSGLHRVPLWVEVLLIVLGVLFGVLVIALVVYYLIYPPFIQWWRSGMVAPEPTVEMQPPAWLLGNDSLLFLFYQERLFLTLIFCFFFNLQDGGLLMMGHVYIYIYIYIDFFFEHIR